jgi:hypothetical protein
VTDLVLVGKRAWGVALDKAEKTLSWSTACRTTSPSSTWPLRQGAEDGSRSAACRTAWWSSNDRAALAARCCWAWHCRRMAAAFKVTLLVPADDARLERARLERGCPATPAARWPTR